MRLTIRITRSTITFTAPNTVIEGQTDYEQYNMKAGIAVAANLRLALAECRLPPAKRPSHLTMIAGGSQPVPTDGTQPQQVSLYDTVTVVTDTPIMLIPQEEYDERESVLMYHFANSGYADDDVMAYPIQPLNVVATYAVGKDLRFVLGETFRGVRYMPLLAPVLTELARQSYAGFQEKVFCYFHDKRTDICAFRKGRIRFCNSFDAHLPADSVYYILNVWQTLGMKPKDILCLAGNIAGLEAMAKELGKFVKNVKHISI